MTGKITQKERYCWKSEQITCGGEIDIKNFTSIEEKPMAILSWIAVTGVDVNEVGFKNKNQTIVEVSRVAFDEIISLVQEATEFDSIEIDGVKPLASTSKRSRRGKVK